MQYALLIALAVVLIAIGPALIRSLRPTPKRGDSQNAPVASAADRDDRGDCDGDGGGDGGGGGE